MSTLVTAVVAALLGIVLAVGASVGVVTAAKQTPDNTDPVSESLFPPDYGVR
jgi:Protein of unknown function (DUF2613)